MGRPPNPTCSPTSPSPPTLDLIPTRTSTQATLHNTTHAHPPLPLILPRAASLHLPLICFRIARTAPPWPGPAPRAPPPRRSHLHHPRSLLSFAPSPSSRQNAHRPPQPRRTERRRPPATTALRLAGSPARVCVLSCAPLRRSGRTAASAWPA